MTLSVLERDPVGLGGDRQRRTPGLGLADDRGVGTWVASVVAASIETTSWSWSRLITTWPPKTGTPSTVCSARTTDPPVDESIVWSTTAFEVVAVDAEGLAVARELLGDVRARAWWLPREHAAPSVELTKSTSPVVVPVDPHGPSASATEPAQRCLGVAGHGRRAAGLRPARCWLADGADGRRGAAGTRR